MDNNNFQYPNNFNYERLSMTNTSFIGYIQGDKIFNQATNQQIGVTNKQYNEALETAKGFQQKLFDAGILKKPKTPEEINQELQSALKETQSMMLQMSNTISALTEKVNAMEENKNVQQTDDDAGRSKNAGAKGSGSIRTNIRLGQSNSDNLSKSEG